jgi:hypothetical protein
MIIVEHRKNSISELELVPSNHGVEIDLRLFHGELVLAHDPFVSGENFENWITNFHHSLLILNVKEEGLEEIILKYVNGAGITNYFFLDQAIPSLIKSIKIGHSAAGRISEFENLTWSRDFSPEWIWLDSFNANWDYLDQAIQRILQLKLKTCLVSPELQGRLEPFELANLKSILMNHNFIPDAVCTKDSSKWER